MIGEECVLPRTTTAPVTMTTSQEPPASTPGPQPPVTQLPASTTAPIPATPGSTILPEPTAAPMSPTTPPPGTMPSTTDSGEIKITMVLGLPLSLEEFDSGAQLKFRSGIAVAAGVDPWKVEITGIEQARRRRSLLSGSIKVGVAVAAPNRAAATSMAGKLSSDTINAELVKLGLPQAQILESASVPGVVVEVPPEPQGAQAQTPAPETEISVPANDQRPVIIGVATALGMIVILVMAWLASKFLLPSARKKDQDSQPSDLERRFMLDDSGESEGPGSIFQKAFDKHPVDSSKKKGQEAALSQPSWENR